MVGAVLLVFVARVHVEIHQREGKDGWGRDRCGTVVGEGLLYLRFFCGMRTLLSGVVVNLG